MTEIRKPRIINTSRILRAIWVARRISRIQLARELGLNKSTVTNIVSELMDSGIIHEVAEGEAGPLGGRRPVQIELNKGFGYVIGLEIRPESYTVVAVDLGGDVLFSRTEEAHHSAENFIEKVNSLLRCIPDELRWIGMPPLGAGVGLSGIVDSSNNVILGSIPLNIDGRLDFAGAIGKNFVFPVHVENDANACAWGELAFHRTQKLRNFIFTLVEFHKNRSQVTHKNTSVGFGIVFDGRVYYGNSHSAGEFRSLFRSPGDPVQFRISTLEDRIDGKPDKFREFIEELSKHLGLFVNTFNLGQVFLGGDIERHQNVVTPILRNAINENWAYNAPVTCEIRFSSLGNKSVAYGAGGMLLERLFREPEAMDLALLGDGTGRSEFAWPFEPKIKAPSEA